MLNPVRRRLKVDVVKSWLAGESMRHEDELPAKQRGKQIIQKSLINVFYDLLAMHKIHAGSDRRLCKIVQQRRVKRIPHVLVEPFDSKDLQPMPMEPDTGMP